MKTIILSILGAMLVQSVDCAALPIDSPENKRNGDSIKQSASVEQTEMAEDTEECTCSPDPDAKFCPLPEEVEVDGEGKGKKDKAKNEGGDAPKAEVKEEEQEYDFGMVVEGTQLEYSFTITNTGNSRLDITEITSSCECIEASAENPSLEPGESTKINVKYDTSNKSGAQRETVLVWNNTPEKVQYVYLSSWIRK